jgi:hypothetical protein
MKDIQSVGHLCRCGSGANLSYPLLLYCSASTLIPRTSVSTACH